MSNRRSMRYVLAAGAITVLLAAAVAFASAAKPSLQDVSEGLTCQCGCGLTVANCNHPQCEFSVPARTQIEAMIAKGMSEGQIIGVFRAKYGEKILSAPTREGFNLLAWIMPFAVVFAGCFIIVGALSRWRANPVVEAEDTANGPAQDDPALRSRLEQEIRE